MKVKEEDSLDFLSAANPDMEIHIQDYIYSIKIDLSTEKNCGFP